MKVLATLGLVLGLSLGVSQATPPYFTSPLTRSDDGLRLGVMIRNYGGEIRVKALSWPATKPNGAIVDIPICSDGQYPGETWCSWDAPEWMLAASVDGGATWLDEALPPIPGTVTTYLITDGAIPMLEWRLPMTIHVSYWKFQRAIPTYDRSAPALVWTDYDSTPEWLYCTTHIIHGVSSYECKRPLPMKVGDDAGEYLYRVSACNFAGCGGDGPEPYAVCIPLNMGVPGTGGAPCFWPDNGACVP